MADMDGRTGTASNPFDPDIPYSERSLAIACTRGRQAVVSHFHTMLTEVNLTEQQWRVLRVLNDFEPVALSAICDYCCIHKVSMTRIIRALSERGLVTRERNSEDLRAYNIRLTPEGRAFLDELTPRANAVSRSIVERFGLEKSAQLIKLLKELATLRGE